MRKLFSILLASAIFSANTQLMAETEIHYTSTDGQVVTPYQMNFGGASLVSNTYSDGSGVMTFNKDVTSIGELVFNEVHNLATIDIPESVVSIGASAFNGCHGLPRIYIPRSVTSIAAGAFGICYNVTQIKVDGYNPQYYDYNCNAIIDKGTKTLVQGCQNTTISSNENYVTTIGSFAFFGQTQLTSINIPSNITRIEGAAFSGCENLMRISNNGLRPQTVSQTSFQGLPIGAELHVREGQYEAFLESSNWTRNFAANFIIGDLYDPNYCKVSDGRPYSGQARHVERLVFERTFNNTNYQALYVPFAIPVSVLNENGLDVMDIYNVHQYDRDGDNIYEDTRIDFLTLRSGETNPNYPYIIKARSRGDVKFELAEADVLASVSNSIDCSTTVQLFTFTGTYLAIPGQVMFDNNYYALSGGNFMRAASPSASLYPQRWYMKIENRDGTPVQYYSPNIRISIDGIEDEANTSAMAEIFGNGSEASVIYNAAGVKMTVSEKSQLPAGVYVQGGKKFIVK